MKRLALISFGLAAAVPAMAQRHPNIVLFMVDDMGWEDSSVPFWSQPVPNNGLYETPNMERLASQGMMFTQAYASSISSPSRCSLLTGANAARHRVTNWTLNRDESTDIPCDTLALPAWNYNGISPVAGVNNSYLCKSFVQILAENGYYTIHCGKAHFGAAGTPGEDPLKLGFDVNIAGHAGGGPASYLSEDNYGHASDGTPVSPFAIPGLEKYWDSGTFLTEALTREALAALDTASAPFFLYMAHYAVHIPIDRDPRYFRKYLEKGMSEKEAAYAALIEGMDKSLGDLMDWLDERGLAEDTVVIFMSDNGGYCTRTWWRDEPLYTQNYPLNSGKGSAYEGGIREPMIVRWPGVAAAGSRCGTPLIIEDFFPSILEMAGIRTWNVPQKVDGKSFVRLLRNPGRRSRHRFMVWNYPNIWGDPGPGIGPTCTIRMGDWKLIHYYADGHKELFNIADDIGETTDLAEARPRVVKRLSRKLGRYLRKVDAQRPSLVRTGAPCPWPDEI